MLYFLAAYFIVAWLFAEMTTAELKASDASVMRLVVGIALAAVWPVIALFIGISLAIESAGNRS